MKSRKLFILVALVVVASMILSACQTPTEEPVVETEAPEAN